MRTCVMCKRVCKHAHNVGDVNTNGCGRGVVVTERMCVMCKPLRKEAVFHAPFKWLHPITVTMPYSLLNARRKMHACVLLITG
jgi:hypothetical protein